MEHIYDNRYNQLFLRLSTITVKINLLVGSKVWGFAFGYDPTSRVQGLGLRCQASGNVYLELHEVKKRTAEPQNIECRMSNVECRRMESLRSSFI